MKNERARVQKTKQVVLILIVSVALLGLVISATTTEGSPIDPPHNEITEITIEKDNETGQVDMKVNVHSAEGDRYVNIGYRIAHIEEDVEGGYDEVVDDIYFEEEGVKSWEFKNIDNHVSMTEGEEYQVHVVYSEFIDDQEETIDHELVTFTYMDEEDDNDGPRPEPPSWLEEYFYEIIIVIGVLILIAIFSGNRGERYRQPPQ